MNEDKKDKAEEQEARTDMENQSAEIPSQTEDQQKDASTEQEQASEEKPEQVTGETGEQAEATPDKSSPEQAEMPRAEMPEETLPAPEGTAIPASDETEANVAENTPQQAETPSAAEETPPVARPEVAGTAPGEDEATATPAPGAEVETPDDSSEDADHDDEEEEDSAEEDVDYSSLSLAELLEVARTQARQDDIRNADRTFKQLKTEIERHNKEGEAAAREKYVAANETDEGFAFQQPAEVAAFFELYRQLRKRKKDHYESLRKGRDNNLKAKQQLIDTLGELVEAADQKGSLNKVKEMQKQWKEIGPVPREHADDLYRTWSAKLDMFYDNKSIEYDLKELDRRKNFEVKQELCDKAEALLQHENINEAINLLRKYHQEYKETGPVPRDVQEEVWQRFKKASDELYEKKRAFSEEYKKQLQENMQIKQELCLQLESFLTFDSDRIKEWNEKTKELLALQEKWDQTGPLPKEVAKDINRQFWGNFKKFFANKGQFFEKLEASRKDNLAQKEELCKQAEELQESKDWNATADKLKKLQQDWRKIGPVPEAQRESIYARFKAACDDFFSRKRNRYAEQEKEYVENMKKKMAICDEIEALGNAKSEDFDKLNELREQYLAIGYVPRKEINKALERFMSVVDKFYDNLPNRSEDEKEKLRLESHVEVYEQQPNMLNKLSRQEQGIRKKISKLENDIALWENNLQFFARSKTADKLKKDFSSKIDKAQKELEELKGQLKIIQKIN